jgi:hypothetical protein
MDGNNLAICNPPTTGHNLEIIPEDAEGWPSNLYVIKSRFPQHILVSYIGATKKR